MLTARETEPGAARTPFTELSDEQRTLIVEELNRILNDHSFKNSKRCTVLLRGVVERALAGDYEAIKERTLAVEIFDREPGYDTSADPIVRSTANEVRKRLAQFYQQPEHQSEVRIGLVPGSYTPVFSWPGYLPDTQSSAPLVTEPPPSLDEIPPDPPPQAPAAPQPHMLRVRLMWAAFGLLAAFVVVAVSAWRVTAGYDPLKLFWSPLLRNPNPVLVCVGELLPLPRGPKVGAAQIASGPYRGIESNGGGVNMASALALEDAVSMSDISGLLLLERKPFNINPESDTTYEYLQKGPVILIGAYNNDWTMHFSRTMRYYFAQNEDGYQWIADQKNPEARLGFHQIGLNQQDFARVPRQDYALVGRLVDTETKQPIILVAGITASATLAASRFITDPKLLSDFLKSAPRNWQNKNMELLLSADVIQNQPGPAHVMASAFW